MGSLSLPFSVPASRRFVHACDFSFLDVLSEGPVGQLLASMAIGIQKNLVLFQ